MKSNDGYSQQYFDSEEEYEQFLANTPLEARFDPATIEFVIIEGFERHKAYGMSFEEYIKSRWEFKETNNDKNVNLSFRMPRLLARVTKDLATKHKISHYAFIIYSIELGLITFKVDYHDEYDTICESRTALYDSLSDENNEHAYLQLNKQDIYLGSGDGERSGHAEHFIPSVEKWLKNAITDMAGSLNMSITDFTYLCMCIGMEASLSDDMLKTVVIKKIESVVSEFNKELRSYMLRITTISDQLKSIKDYDEFLLLKNKNSVK